MIRAHVIEDNIVSKIAEALEDLDADLTEIEIEVPSLKYSIERQMFSTMKFNLVGKEVEEAFNRIEKNSQGRGWKDNKHIRVSESGDVFGCA